MPTAATRKPRLKVSGMFILDVISTLAFWRPDHTGPQSSGVRCLCGRGKLPSGWNRERACPLVGRPRGLAVQGGWDRACCAAGLAYPRQCYPHPSLCASVLEVSQVGSLQTHALQRTEHQEQSRRPRSFWENPEPIKWSHAVPGIHPTSPEAGPPASAPPASRQVLGGNPCPAGARRLSRPCHLGGSSKAISVFPAPAATRL